MRELELLRPQLVDPTSGRIDALRVASYLNVGVEDVALMVRQPLSLVWAYPTAPVLQDRLGDVAWVINGLLEILGGQREQALVWLNAPHWALDDESPLDLMRGDELSVVVDLVDDILSGAPA